MTQFSTLWNNHVGRDYVCDQNVFANQCAMRMGKALEDTGISLESKSLKRCSNYSTKFKDHKPGHIRSILDGSIDDNLSAFKNKKGMVFIMNGWGNTDHIDVWNGVTMRMKGASDTITYRKRGKQVWFWELM